MGRLPFNSRPPTMFNYVSASGLRRPGQGGNRRDRPDSARAPQGDGASFCSLALSWRDSRCRSSTPSRPQLRGLEKQGNLAAGKLSSCEDPRPAIQSGPAAS